MGSGMTCARVRAAPEVSIATEGRTGVLYAASVIVWRTGCALMCVQRVWRDE